MSSNPKVARLFAVAFMLFFARAFMFSTWVSRGPEVKELLALNTVQLGVLTMLYPVAGLVGITYAGALVQRFGSRVVSTTIFVVGCASLALLGPAITGGHVWITGLLLLTFGLPMAIADFVANYEGNLADKASKSSLFPALHGAYGLGMMAAAALAGMMTDAGVDLGVHYLLVAAVAAVGSLGAAMAVPRHDVSNVTPEEQAQQRRQRRAVLRERRSLLIAVVGFSFIMAEMTAGTWVPIALTNSGFSTAKAAFAFSIFWIVVTVVRLLGGFIVDVIGRQRTVQISALLTALGVGLFMLGDVVSLPYPALILWGAGMALGFPMSVSAMGDDPAWAAARINLAVSVVYVASITVGPALGSVGQVFGLSVAFGIPLAILLIAAALSGVTKAEPRGCSRSRPRPAPPAPPPAPRRTSRCQSGRQSAQRGRCRR